MYCTVVLTVAPATVGGPYGPGCRGGDAVPEGFVRLPIGAEEGDDLVADPLRALDAARP